MKNFRISKKLTTAILTGLFIAFNDYIGLDLSMVEISGIVVTAVGYIYGQSKVDQKLIEGGLKHK